MTTVDLFFHSEVDGGRIHALSFAGVKLLPCNMLSLQIYKR